MSTISQPQNEATLERQSIDFANRILKRYKHLKKWAKRTDVHAFRIYDKDIPKFLLQLIFMKVKRRKLTQNLLSLQTLRYTSVLIKKMKLKKQFGLTKWQKQFK